MGGSESKDLSEESDITFALKGPFFSGKHIEDLKKSMKKDFEEMMKSIKDSKKNDNEEIKAGFPFDALKSISDWPIFQEGGFDGLIVLTASIGLKTVISK